MNDKKITDTTKNPMPSALLGANPSAILGQEAKGAAELRKKDQLPREGTEGQEEIWAKIGVKLGPVRDGDIFRDAWLPEGWIKVSDSRDPRHIEIKDNQGRIRATMFYKAAFYDRKANVNLLRRYLVQRAYEDKNSARWFVIDITTEKTLHSVAHTLPDQESNNQEYYGLSTGL